MAKPLVLDLHIPYCIRPENYLAYFNASIHPQKHSGFSCP